MSMSNPFYHWRHLELARYFGITELLKEKSAKRIYEEASSTINSPGYHTLKLLRKVHVEYVCTTKDPIDTLEFHQELIKNEFEAKVGTAFRPDKIIPISNDDYNEHIGILGEKADTTINTCSDLCCALRNRIDYFDKNGCKICDHGLILYFLDQKDRITKQLNAQSNRGLISSFIGMLTDSRSFLSFPRYEYFRCILCNLLRVEIKKTNCQMTWNGLVKWFQISVIIMQGIFQIIILENKNELRTS